MDESELNIDGTGVAGLLQPFFVTDLTTVRHVCQSCHEEHPVGAHRAYAGAGTVLRCPNCGDVAAVVSVLPGESVIGLNGAWRLPTPTE
jgi:Family of unknown function (DUF6510)